MSSFLRILLFVPPIFFFVFPAFSQIQGKLVQVPGSDTYRVSIVPTVNWSPPMTVTSSAQVTIRAASGELNLTNFQSTAGQWSAQNPVVSPSEAPDFDYFYFTLDAPISNLNFIDGVEISLFTFENSLGCTYLELIDNNSDPFLPPNSLNVNVANSFSVIGAGVNQNAYQGNTSEFSASCPSLDFSVIASNNPVKCHGYTTNVSFQAFGGKEPYLINWINTTTGSTGSELIPDYEGNLTLKDLFAGTYSFSIQDAADSLSQKVYKILEPDPINIELSSFPANCNGSMDGVAFVDNVTGGTVLNDYQYFWNTNPGSSSQSIGFLDPGKYSVTVVDDNGCEAEEQVEVGAFTLITILNKVEKDVSCFGEADGFIDIYPFSTTAPFTFEWSANAQALNQSSASNLGPGMYTVKITDGTGVCFITDTFNIQEPPPIEVDYTIFGPRCYGEKGVMGNISVENAFEPYTINIIGESEQLSANEFEVEPGLPSRLQIEDANGCIFSEDFLIPAKQEMYVDVGEDQSIKYGQEVSVEALVFPLEDVRMEWIPSEGLSCNDCPNPVASPIETTRYSLKLTDSLGCTVEDQMLVSVTKSRDIYIPNAFSPNFDGVNDVFCPFGGFEVVQIKSMYVFDRWGGIVYKNEKGFNLSEPKIGWDGTFRGKVVNSGTYLYSMNIEFIDGETVLFSGEVNLLR